MDNTYKLAIIGNESSITLFRAIGAESFPVYSGEDARESVTTLMNTYSNEAEQIAAYAIVFIEEEYYKQLPEDLLERLAKRSLPALIPLPSLNSTDEKFAVNRLSKIVERAIGSDILS